MPHTEQNVSMSESSVFMANDHTWDISHGQYHGRGIFRTSRAGRSPCDMSFMAEGIDINAIRETIAREMELKGFKARGLSLKVSNTPTLIRDLLQRTENPGIGTLYKIAEALELPFESISGTQRVPLTGRIGAGGAIAWLPDDEQELVSRPPLAPGPLMALQVAGDSMLPKYEPGDIVYIRRDHDGVLPEYLGDYCAIHLTDGGTYLKRLAAGTEPGRYTLRSLNAADMENVEIVWASPVLFIMPRRSR